MLPKGSQVQTSAKSCFSQNHLVHIAGAAMIVLAGLLALALSLLGPGTDTYPYHSLGIKILEVLVQTVAVTVAGGLLVQAYLKWHSRELAINDFRRALLDGLIKDYMDVKRVRRLLRASADHLEGGTDSNPWTHLPIGAYYACMTELNATELSLEVLCRRVEIFASVFPDATSLVAGVGKMHGYLEELVEEFERHKRFKNAASDSLQISELKALSGFVLRRERSSFRGFADPYHELLRALQGGAIRVSL